MKDFQPDYFSITSLNYSSVPLKNLYEIKNILKNKFPIVDRVLDAKKLSGLNINSSNIKITSGTGNYILKYWNSKDLDRINQICKILLHLNSEGVSTPVPVTTTGNEFIFEFEKGNLTLFNYIDGEIFQPVFADLQSYFASVSKLFISLRRFNNESKNYNLYPDPELISNTLNRAVMNNSSELQIRFPEDFIKLKEMHKKLRRDIERYPTIMHNNEKQFSHYDLHPKNILKQKKGNYAFLDFESCVFSDPNIAWGFTLIKILRQVVAGSEEILDPIVVGKKSLDLIQDQEFADALTVPLLPVFGRVEVLRRLTYIIDEFENYNSETWLSMLPIQVQLLKESYILFPQK